MEARYGFIREKLDIKILILFVLNRLPEAVGVSDLADIVMCDNGIGYFEFVDSLSDLVGTGHVMQSGDMYIVTPKGKRNGEITESSIAYSVRVKAECGVMRMSRVQKRNSMIKTDIKARDNGGYTVKLSLADSFGEIISLEMLVADEAQANNIEKRFQKNAEDLYTDFMSMLLYGD